jgi:hypothetical protein
MAKSKKLEVHIPEPDPIPVRIDIGCGKNQREGFDGIDSIDYGQKYVHDVRNGLPFADNSVDEVFCSHFLEHTDGRERVAFMNELYRVMKVGSTAQIICPCWQHSCAYGDPTHCFSEDTEILAEEGWRLIKDVRIGDRVLGLNSSDESTEYVHVNDVIMQPYVGKMLHFETKRMDLMVTPNHDLIWRSKGNKGYDRPPLRKSSAKEFVGLGGHHPRRASAVINWAGSTPDRIRIAEDSEYLGRKLPGDFDAKAFAEFMGWYVSEGCVDLTSKNHYRIKISQKLSVNGPKVDEIVDVIQRLGYKPMVRHDGVTFSCKSLALWLKELGKQDVRYIPKGIKSLSPELLKLFISSAVKGDGTINSGGTKNGAGFSYATTSAHLASDMQEVSLKAGYRSTHFIEKRIGITSQINGREFINQHDMHWVSICDSKDAWYPQPKEVTYSGNQVCVTVEKHNNIMVRRNGKAIWSGNCFPPISQWTPLYWVKSWRDVNGPHTGYTCDFDYVIAGSWDISLEGRNPEYKQMAMNSQLNAWRDIIFTITKRPLE